MASGCFDRLAATYDEQWTDGLAGLSQRAAVWRHLSQLIRPGDRALDLGCGTGEDAARLAACGACVSAWDASPAMVRAACARGVDAEVKRIEEIAELSEEFDAVLSNFGALNCVENVADLRKPLARIVRPGGLLILCVMGRFCLWETAYYSLRGRFRKAVRRWSGRAFCASLDLHVFYPTARELNNDLGPEFRLHRHTGIGLLTPPSYVKGISARWFERLSRIDRAVAHLPAARILADHQLLIFRRL